MKPILVFDGDCGFCRFWIERWKPVTQDRIDYAPYQEAAERFPHIPRREFETSVQLFESDGKIYGGAEAVFRALAHAPGKGWALKAYRLVPGVAPASELVYRFVAVHRPLFTRLTRVLWGEATGPDSYVWSRWVFLRLLGAVYLIAFLSLNRQVLGLLGTDGILPAAGYLEAVRTHLGGEGFLRVPTLFWLWPTDVFLRVLCLGGAVLATLLIVGIAPVLILILLWVFYLSLVSVGGDFLSFQWDNLLLEAGFLAIFFAPGGAWPRPGRETPPSRSVHWLLRWLLFRLMFSSGVVKLMSGDAAWHDLTALRYHYETQPLPAWTSWFAHQIPSGYQKFSVALMFAVELGAPFLIFLPRRPKHLAFMAFSLLQLLIGSTGNYCFFNLLTFALAVLLLDDTFLAPLVPNRSLGVGRDLPLPNRPRSMPRHPGRGDISWPHAVLGKGERVGVRVRWVRRLVVPPISLLILLLSTSLLLSLFERPRRLPSSVRQLHSLTAPFRSINGYGLFAIMTTGRDEIIIEGSDDQETWREYEFKWKPGDVFRRPGFAQPHQPRLDWQMWFAALSRYEREPWLANCLVRLLQGSPEVLRLLEKTPFPDRPPIYVRAVLYRYTFTSGAERRRTGAWWSREYIGPYSPVLTLRSADR